MAQRYLSESGTEQGENIITGALLDALHPLTPRLFIKGEFLRAFGIYLSLAEIITLKALMRPAWASKFLNLYEFLNSWGVNISRWESGQLTCICQPLRSPQSELQEMMQITGHPLSRSFGSFQPPVWTCSPASKVEITAAELGVL